MLCLKSLMTMSCAIVLHLTIQLYFNHIFVFKQLMTLDKRTPIKPAQAERKIVYYL